MDIPSAELTKYAANAMLATRISFMNDMAILCEQLGANINHVRAGIGSDPRIGKKFLYSGIGYGGSCFPKDVKALVQTGLENNHPLRILKAVEEVNEDQKHVLFKKIDKYFSHNLQEKTIAVWGLSFKPNTDDMRFAPSLVLIKALLHAGAKVNVFDPVAMSEAKKHLHDSVTWCKNVYDTVNNADAIALVTEWNEFKIPDWAKILERLKGRAIFDGRNIYEPAQLKELGFDYHGIGFTA